MHSVKSILHDGKSIDYIFNGCFKVTMHDKITQTQQVFVDLVFNIVRAMHE